MYYFVLRFAYGGVPTLHVPTDCLLYSVFVGWRRENPKVSSCVDCSTKCTTEDDGFGSRILRAAVEQLPRVRDYYPHKIFKRDSNVQVPPPAPLRRASCAYVDPIDPQPDPDTLHLPSNTPILSQMKLQFSSIMFASFAARQASAFAFNGRSQARDLASRAFTNSRIMYAKEGQAEVILVGCGAPNRGMGWYHGIQMLEDK